MSTRTCRTVFNSAQPSSIRRPAITSSQVSPSPLDANIVTASPAATLMQAPPTSPPPSSSSSSSSMSAYPQLDHIEAAATIVTKPLRQPGVCLHRTYAMQSPPFYTATSAHLRGWCDCRGHQQSPHPFHGAFEARFPTAHGAATPSPKQTLAPPTIRIVSSGIPDGQLPDLQREVHPTSMGATDGIQGTSQLAVRVGRRRQDSAKLQHQRMRHPQLHPHLVSGASQVRQPSGFVWPGVEY